MTPQTTEFLEKANRLLAEAEFVLGHGFNEAAGRGAYLAAFHAAQALIFENRSRVAKTHAGVQTEFQRLTKDDPRVDAELRRFLSHAYNLKAAADYETGPASDISSERAKAAVCTARRFIHHVTSLLPPLHGHSSE